VTDPPGRVRRVCVVARFWEPGLGDFVQRNIFLSLLRRAYPEADIVHVVGEEHARRFREFFARHSYATRVLACPDYGDDEPAAWRRFLRELRDGCFDVCVVDPDSRGLDARMAASAGIPVRIGYLTGSDADGSLTHGIRLGRPIFGLPDLYDYARGLAEALGIGDLRPSATVPAFPFRPEPIDMPPTPVVAVHPGGARHWNRRWPADSYVDLCREIVTGHAASILLIGSSDEVADLDSLRDRIGEGRPETTVVVGCGRTINWLASNLSRVDVLVGSDSAPAHIAAALGRPTVVLYGPTMTEFMWARVYPRHRGINLRYDCQSVRNLPRGAGTTTMPCRFSCHYPYESADGPYPKCLADIGVDRVLQAVAGSLSSLKPNGTVAWTESR
jgi:ADP-heptose:LPS heptosyltransferase